MRQTLRKVIERSSVRAMTWLSPSRRVDHMISPHAHIAMTYQAPAPEAKHVHRVAKPKVEKQMKRRTVLAQRLHIAPRSA
jgi:hypothetical protein